MRSKSKPKHPPRRVLRLPDLDHAKRAVLNSLGSAASARAYTHAIDDFIEWYCSEPRLAFSKPVVLRYRIELEGRQLSASTINLRLAAVRRLAYEAADSGLLSPELAAGIQRVKGEKRLGVRLGNWLTAEQWGFRRSRTLNPKGSRTAFRDKPEHLRSVATLASRLCKKCSASSRKNIRSEAEVELRCGDGVWGKGQPSLAPPSAGETYSVELPSRIGASLSV